MFLHACVDEVPVPSMRVNASEFLVRLIRIGLVEGNLGRVSAGLVVATVCAGDHVHRDAGTAGLSTVFIAKPDPARYSGICTLRKSDRARMHRMCTHACRVGACFTYVRMCGCELRLACRHIDTPVSPAPWFLR